jgi:hypothetical protein
MTKLLSASFIALGIAIALPAAAQQSGLEAPANLNQDQLLSWVTQSGICGGQPLVHAQYEGRSQVKITCGETTGFVPTATAGTLGGTNAGLVAVIGGLGLAALAAGGGGSTNTTNNTQ